MSSIRWGPCAQVAIVIGSLALACSGSLEGERVRKPVRDWSFVEQAEGVSFATADGQRFQTVEARPLVQDGDLYLHAQTIFSADDEALDALLSGADVEMQVGDRIYPLQATHLSSSAEIEALLPTLVRKDMHIEATGIRWEPDSKRYPGTQVRQWFFRLESPAS